MSSDAHTTDASALTPRLSPFARAIDSFLSDVKRSEDFKSPFFKEVLSQLSTLVLHDGSGTQSHKCATDLAAFIEDMELRKRRESKTLRITQRLRPLVSALSQYVATIDVVIQAAPTAAVVLYCGARLVLQLAQNFYACFDKVLEIMAEIGHLLQCYRLFSTAFSASHEMQDLLVESYKNIVCFWQKASHILGRKSYKTLLTGLIKPLDAEWQKCRAGLDRDRIRVQSLAQATESDLRQQTELKTADTRQGEKRQRLVEWMRAGEDLAKLDIRVDLRTNLEHHQAGTCTWILEDPTFKDWYSTKSNAALWYHAGPGSGKTVLSSVLINHLQEQRLSTIYFFFAFNDPKRRKLITALRSLSLQLLTQSGIIPDRVTKLYEADLLHNVPVLQDIHTAVLVLQAFLKSSSRVHIILDGLDECYDNSQMVGTFVNLISTATYGISKWFFTSRDEQAIQSIAQQVGATEIVPLVTAVMSDIRRFVKDHVVEEELPRGCVECWTTASEGNFLWISLMLKVLMGMDLTCEEDIEEELENFPKGLTGCYVRSLQQLSMRPPKVQELARRIFTILVVAEQPLHLSELSNALGVRENSECFSPKRIPKKELIESLCSHLFTFDRTVRGSENDPLLKFAHKSVKEFFLQNPQSLSVAESLHTFFVDPKTANLELGRACVRYLSYNRYQTPEDDILGFIDGDPNKEHTFLKYAATFWFWHLIQASHSRSLFEEIERFIRSPAFWTCIAVQCKIAPHLFAPLMELHLGHFSLGEGYSGDRQDDEKVKFAFPLPDWLEEYCPSGPVLVQAFMAFIKEWHLVLTSFPQSINQCLTEVFGYDAYPYPNPFESGDTRVISLLPTAFLPGNSAKSSLLSIKMEEDNLSALILETDTGSDQLDIVICTKFASEGVPTREEARREIHGLESTIYDLQISFDTDKERLSIWSLDLNSLCLLQNPDSNPRVFKPKGAIKSISAASSIHSLTPWAISMKHNVCASYGNIFSYHCVKKLGVVRDERDSGYGTSVAGSSSDRDFDSDGDDDDDDDEESEARDKKLPVNYHCLVLVYQEGVPIWFSWQVDAGLELQVVHAYHPTEPLAIWSHTLHEICKVDLRTGHVDSEILFEPVDIQLQSAAAIRKEFHFSEDGKTLYYMLCTFVDGQVGSTCSVSVSTFACPNRLADLQDLLRSQPAQHITYQLNKSLKDLCAPYILTYWSPTHLYIVLPSLSCNPKIVRFALTPTDDTSCATSSAFQTMDSQIYFPHSVPYRSPKLFVLPYSPTTKSDAAAALDDADAASTKSSESLILALDQNHPPFSAVAQNTHSALPPILIIWPIFSPRSWRDWDAELDERSPECQGDGAGLYNMLRGSFVDSAQRFSIPIRSGLDWRKKAFVSCA